MNQYPLNPVDFYEDFLSFLRGIEKYGDKPAITTYTSEKEAVTRSYRQLTEDVYALAAAMREKGWQGCHVALAGENSYQWVVAFFASAVLNCPVVLVDIEQSVETIAQMLETADSQVAFASDSAAELFAQEADMPKLPLVASGGEYGIPFTSLLEEGRCLLKEHDHFFDTLPAEENLAVIAFTSGTTSASKPVMLSRKGVLHNASSSVAMVATGERLFASLPFYHTYGLTCSVLGPLIVGTHLCINGSLKTMMRDLRLFQPDTMMTVPLIVEMVHRRLAAASQERGLEEELNHKARRRFLRREPEASVSEKLENLKNEIFPEMQIIISGGAHLLPEISLELKRFGIQTLQGYGITECSPLISVNRNQMNQPESVGVVVPGVELRFQEGEILVRGENVMLGYYKDEEMTREAMGDGWFHTGDLGYLDKRGFLYITGRKKNLIVLKNGKKVSPEEIESRIARLPLVKEVMAYGATTGQSADDVKIAVTVYPDPKEAGGMTSYEILNTLQKEIESINGHYPSYKQIQLVNLRENEFSKTSSQKIKRREL